MLFAFGLLCKSALLSFLGNANRPGPEPPLNWKGRGTTHPSVTAGPYLYNSVQQNTKFPPSNRGCWA